MMNFELNNNELMTIIKKYYVENHGLDVEVQIKDRTCGDIYYGTSYEKRADITQKINVFGLDKLATETLDMGDIEKILNKSIDNDYTVKSLNCFKGKLSIDFDIKSKKRIRTL